MNHSPRWDSQEKFDSENEELVDVEEEEDTDADDDSDFYDDMPEDNFERVNNQ